MKHIAENDASRVRSSVNENSYQDCEHLAGCRVKGSADIRRYAMSILPLASK